MKKYDEYKDSGFDWIGEIPAQWDNLRLRFVCELRNGYTPSKDNSDYWEDGTIPWYRMEDIRDTGRKLQEAKQYITEEAVKGGGLFDAGSFILATTATIGEHALLIVESLANQRFTNLKIRKSLSNILSRDYFFYYLFVIDDYCKATTKTSTFPAVSMELLKNCQIVFPSFCEQVAIATYLDTHCAKIDNLISIQQKRIALLQELKQSVITHAVTKGLNPNVEMKQSGVEWIGDVPKHWEVCKLKHYSQVVLGKMLMTSPPKDSEGLYTLEKYLKSKNVGWLQLFLDEDNIDEMWFNQYEKSIYKLQENDIVMNEGGDIGKVSCWRGVDFDCYIQNSINKITADYNRVNAGFLCYWLYNLSSLGYFWSIVSQISIAHLTKEKLSNSPVVLPPITEQAAIASYLDHKCATIDTSISNAQHQIDLLQEYKQSLITEVVTGKRKVTDN